MAEEELTNGIEHNPEEVFKTASIKIEVIVSEVAGKPVVTETDQALFLELMNAFFGSDMVYENLKMFVQFYMEQNAVPEIIIPDKPKLVLP